MDNKAVKIIVRGKLVDGHTRCVHYNSGLDVIAVKFKCCGQYYSCYYCHGEMAGHPAECWPKTDYDVKAVLCGMCSAELTITDYKASNYQCPVCKSNFNPACVNHNHFYFEQ